MEQILKRQQALLGRVDAWFAASMRRYPEQISCRSGCSACCRSLFDITLLDAYNLKLGFRALPAETRKIIEQKCRQRLSSMRLVWSDLDHPYLLNCYPEEEWQALIDADETPCVLLGEDGRCLLYDSRPMTCRLHGIPQISGGEVTLESCCSLNFVGWEPLDFPGLEAPFDALFREEVEIFREFTGLLLGERVSELDTFIATALLIDFDLLDCRC
jgi:Fe-S-cluster containining protein